MKIIETKFKGLKIIQQKNNSDSRGSLREIYRKKLLPKGMILNDLLDDYTISSATYVIRR